MSASSSITTLLFAIFALAVVLALAWLVIKGLATMSKHSSANAPMRIIATLPMGSRERLTVVQYKGSDYLLGVSTNSISLIDKHPSDKYPSENAKTDT